jgi:hypothetical protein
MPQAAAQLHCDLIRVGERGDLTVLDRKSQGTVDPRHPVWSGL